MTDIFEEDTFVILTKDKALKEKTDDQISECGGTVTRAVNKRATVVVCDNGAEYADIIKSADDLKIPVVAFSFVTASIAAKARADPTAHKLGATSTPAKSVDDEPAAKKQKVDDASGVQKETEWMGVSTGSDGSPYPFVLEITTVDGENITGGIKWPTLGKGALTKIKGTIKGDVIKFEEYEAVYGDEDVELPMFYTGKVNGNAISGKLKDKSGEECNFNLTKIKTRTGTASIPSTPAVPTKDLSKYKGLPMFAPKSEFNGKLTSLYPFSLNLTTLKHDGAVEGVISWPTAAAKTKFTGQVKDTDLTFDETEVLTGDGVDVPVKYTAKVDADTQALTGKYETSTSTGTFDLKIKTN